jgi:S-adenosylmethionine hydrolase
VNGLVTLATDFGESDWFVGVMKGVMLRFNPDIRLVDLSHRIAPHSIASAAYFLTQAYPYFPSGTVHLAVVDPGVGSGRRAAVVETAHHVLVGPDNGMFWPVTQAMGGGRWFSLENPEWLAGSVSPTFHGRDVFAPAAARLASGESVERAGPEMADPVRFEWPRPQRKPEGWHGEVLYIDRFGNCLTNLSRAFTVGGGTEPGEPPVIVAIQVTAEGVEIVWEPAGQGVYTIERAPAPTGPFEPIASGVTSDRHLDTAPPEGQAFYRVIRTDGGTPVDIDPIRVQITGITVSPDGNPVLHWTAEGDSAYRITRSADFNGPYTTLTDEAQGGTWEDAAPEAQHAFYQIWLLP